jgi:hypothetical protein
MHILETLISPAHALCYLTVKKQSVIHIQAWPSWLCSGYKSHIAVFNQLFYADQANLPNCHRCNLCHKPVRTSIWAHALVECTQLHQVDSDPMWLAFVSLISLGYQGLALYTCFPLFCKYHDQLRLLILGWRPVTHLVFWHIGGFKFIYIVNLEIWRVRWYLFFYIAPQTICDPCAYIDTVNLSFEITNVWWLLFLFFLFFFVFMISTEYAWASVSRIAMCTIFYVLIFYALFKIDWSRVKYLASDGNYLLSQRANREVK